MSRSCEQRCKATGSDRCTCAAAPVVPVGVITIRAASAADGRFLERMLVLAADWRPGTPAREVETMLSDPELARYVVGWPLPTDFGVVADDRTGKPIGAAWCRFFSEEHPGYGFVSPDVPEVSVGVVAEARGAGVGRALVSALIEEARRRAIERLSLSVEVDNFATRLYTDLDFEVVDEVGGAATMVVSTDRARPT